MTALAFRRAVEDDVPAMMRIRLAAAAIRPAGLRRARRLGAADETAMKSPSGK